ncbi:hypothetical protein AS888_05470 [Peribacillus simplex]|uniref:DUF4279 domain-containing protein n=1 Tax=Peribacillus simplex TaxID=1478 RepID=A0A120GQW4_9BACI|nr:DUF4279 domain-containing protein [Peribacillus simplex]KWW21932.1 hypothetical protein AS888_05470 [Peribacillus simplex]
MAYFSVFGDEFALEVVTDILSIEPTKTYKKGDIIEKINNPNLVSTKIRRRKETVWTLSTGYQESYDINNQLNTILKSLEGKTKELKQLKEKYSLEFLFMIVIQVENDEKPAMYLQKNIIDFSSLIQAEIHFDLYIFS